MVIDREGKDVNDGGKQGTIAYILLTQLMHEGESVFSKMLQGASSAVSEKELKAIQPGMVVKLSIGRQTSSILGKVMSLALKTRAKLQTNDGREIAF